MKFYEARSVNTKWICSSNSSAFCIKVQSLIMYSHILQFPTFVFLFIIHCRVLYVFKAGIKCGIVHLLLASFSTSINVSAKYLENIKAFISSWHTGLLFPSYRGRTLGEEGEMFNDIKVDLTWLKKKIDGEKKLRGQSILNSGLIFFSWDETGSI